MDLGLPVATASALLRSPRQASYVAGSFLGNALWISQALRVLHVSSLGQFLVLAGKRRFSMRSRLLCWSLLRRARKGRNLVEREWNVLRYFLRKGLLRQRPERAAYQVNHLIVWHPQLIVR